MIEAENTPEQTPEKRGPTPPKLCGPSVDQKIENVDPKNAELFFGPKKYCISDLKMARSCQMYFSEAWHGKKSDRIFRDFSGAGLAPSPTFYVDPDPKRGPAQPHISTGAGPLNPHGPCFFSNT